MRYSHVACIAFTVESDRDSGDLTDAELLAALEARIANLRQYSEGLLQEGTVWVDETIDSEESCGT